MSKIEEEGFLSNESEDGKSHLIEKYSDFFEFAREMNRLCMKLLSELRIDWEDKHKLITHTLFIRTVENYQGVYLLLERGMMAQAKVLTRSMLEALFTLVALQKKPKLLASYLDQHEESYRRGLKAAMKFKSKSLKEAAKMHGLEKRYIEKKQELKNRELKALSPIEWAIEAELEDYYNVYYVTYSNSIHSNLSALDDHIDETKDDINLSMGPSDIDLYDVLKCGIFILLNAANSIELVNGNDISSKLHEYENRFEELESKHA